MHGLYDSLCLFASLFRGRMGLSAKVYVPGVVLLAGYAFLSVTLGPDNHGRAFGTAFVAALGVRITLGLDGMLRPVLRRFSPGQAALIAATCAAVPLAVLIAAEDPVLCQRLQSLIYLAFGSVFLLDVVKGQVVTAANLWPDRSMRRHLPGLTRMMVIYNFAFLLLNETMIQTLAASTWLLFWAMLPVLAHSVLRALVLTVINLDDDGRPV